MKVTIMRGLPGSGKSWWIRHLESISCGIVSADHYFMKNGEYCFDPTQLTEAHASCFRRYIEHLEEGFNVIVDNTNLHLWEISPYVLAAQAFGAEIEIVRINTSIESCIEDNVHGVPEETIRRMAESFEDLPPFYPQEQIYNRPKFTAVVNEWVD